MLLSLFLLWPAGPGVSQTMAAVGAQIPQIPSGMARVWFLRQFQPAESLATPMISVNGVPVAASEPGGAFYRDFPPGSYTFTVASYGIDIGQAQTSQLAPGMAVFVEIQSLSSWASGDEGRHDTFYARAVSPEWAEKYFPTMTYLGAR